MKRLNLLLNLTIVITLLLVACGTSQPEEPAAPVSADSEHPVGGTFVYVLSRDLDTLDVHKSALAPPVAQYLGANLISKDPVTGEYIPYLAESWTIAEDGLTYEFKLREDVKFHDGTPLTAQDYAWSFSRAKDPKTQSPLTGPQLTGLAIAEAVDDHTLRLKMAWPNSTLMDSLATSGFHQPLSQAYVEKMGEDYGRNPIGVGPYKFKEWVTGEKIVLERNPDFTWGPAWTHGGAPYIEFIEYRIIPEYSTQLAGLEAGELDYVDLEIKDLERIQDSGLFQIHTGLAKGAGTFIAMNTTKPPFDDIRVRQAFNHVVNKDVLIQVVSRGHALPLSGPLTPATLGYWSGVEEIGYEYDLEKAQELMVEAGYILNSDGRFEKDGEPLVLEMKVDSSQPKDAEVLQEQFREFGVQINVSQLEDSVWLETVSSGDFDLTIEDLSWDNFGILFAMLNSSMVGIWNHAGVTDMDEMIGAMTTASSDAALEEASIVAQTHIVEQAIYVPLYAESWYSALNNRVKDMLYSEITQDTYIFDAYIEQ